MLIQLATTGYAVDKSKKEYIRFFNVIGDPGSQVIGPGGLFTPVTSAPDNLDSLSMTFAMNSRTETRKTVSGNVSAELQ